MLAGGSARAAILEFEFEGMVTILTADDGLFGATGTVQIGDPFTGHFSYEVGPSNPDQEPGDPEVGAYNLTEFVVDQSLVPWTSILGVSVQHVPPIGTFPPDPPDPGRDVLRAVATTTPYPVVSVFLRGPFGSAFSDDSLPSSLDLADFPDGAFVQGLVAGGLDPFPSIEDVGIITALRLVPEPGALALLGAAVAALSLRARARRARAGAR
jgi:hypothetical protein